MANSSGPPNAVGFPMAAPDVHRSGWATKQDWNRYQGLIGQLYEKQPLVKVMEYMTEQHGFKATTKMYKTHIKQWKLDKKSKEPEMRAIVRKTKQLKDQGKRATFRVRGRLYDDEDVVRYWERKGVSVDDIIAQRSESKTPEAVNWVASPASPMMTPESMAIPERILLSIRDYFKGSFENGTWVTTDPRWSCRTTKTQENPVKHLNLLREKSEIACALFAKHHFQEAGHVLISATSGINSILLAEHPEALTQIFVTVSSFLTWGRDEIALALLRQIFALAEIRMGRRHPLYCICWWLASIHTSQFRHVLARCSVSMGDHFESLVGAMHISTLDSRMYFIEEFADDMDTSHKIVLLRGLLGRCEGTLGYLDHRTLRVRMSLAVHYFDKKDYAEALRMSQDIVADAQLHEPSFFRCQGLYVVARSQYALGKADSAELNLRQAIDIRIMLCRSHDALVGTWLMRLEEWLIEQGQLVAAAQVQERWKEVLIESSD